MQVKYKVLSVNPAEHSCIVRFFSDEVPESALANAWGPNGEVLRTLTDVNLNIYEQPTPTGGALDEYILRHAPTEYLKLKAAVADETIDTSMDELKAMVGEVRSAA